MPQIVNASEVPAQGSGVGRKRPLEWFDGQWRLFQADEFDTPDVDVAIQRLNSSAYSRGLKSQVRRDREGNQFYWRAVERKQA